MFNNVAWSAREGLDADKIQRMLANDRLNYDLLMRAPTGLLAFEPVANRTINTNGVTIFNSEVINKEHLSTNIRRMYRVNVGSFRIEHIPNSASSIYATQRIRLRFRVRYRSSTGVLTTEPAFFPYPEGDGVVSSPFQDSEGLTNQGFHVELRMRPELTETVGSFSPGTAPATYRTQSFQFFFSPPDTTRFRNSPNKFNLVVVAFLTQPGLIPIQPSGPGVILERGFMTVEDVGGLPDGVSLP